MFLPASGLVMKKCMQCKVNSVMITISSIKQIEFNNIIALTIA